MAASASFFLRYRPAANLACGAINIVAVAISAASENLRAACREAGGIEKSCSGVSGGGHQRNGDRKWARRPREMTHVGRVQSSLRLGGSTGGDDAVRHREGPPEACGRLPISSSPAAARNAAGKATGARMGAAGVNQCGGLFRRAEGGEAGLAREAEAGGVPRASAAPAAIYPAKRRARNAHRSIRRRLLISSEAYLEMAGLT